MIRETELRQIRIGLCHPPTPREIERRYRCIDSRHEGRTYNPAQDRTWCLCGRVIRPGDVAVQPSTYERAESDAYRTDVVGVLARAYLDEAHGRSEAGPAVVPSEAGEQYVIDLVEVP